MSATISHLPGAKSATEDPAELSRVPLPVVPERVLRIIELYRWIAEQPAEVRRGPGVTSILRALNEGRDGDAFDLREIVLEEIDPEASEAADESDDGYGTPIPHAAQVWRRPPGSARPRSASSPPLLTLVTEATISGARARELRPARSMAVDQHGWTVSAGDLEIDDLSRRARLDLGSKGEAFILLRSGAVTLTMEGKPVSEVACGDAGPRLARIVFSGRSDARSTELGIEATGATPPDGIWVLSTRSDPEPMAGDPSPATFTSEIFQAIGPATPTAFCDGARILPTSEHHRHRNSIERGDYVRFGLVSEQAPAPERPLIDLGRLRTATTAMMAAPTAGTVGVRQLDEHDDAIEIIMVMEGVVWVAVAPSKGPGLGEDREPATTPPMGLTPGSHQPVFVTPLFSTMDGEADIMLLRPTYGHSVWMTPGSRSRFLHLVLDDPAKIEVLTAPRAGDTAASEAALRGAGRR